MIARLVEFAITQRALICLLGVVLLFGGLYAFHVLDVVAYPDPAPPMIEVITQYPGYSSQEIERIITIPIEVNLAAMPHLTEVRSLSILGLSDIKFYFEFGSDYFKDRQEVLNRLAMMNFPPGVQPQISPWWSIAEIYRYELTGEDHGYSLTDLKTIQDWQVRREFKRVPGVIDVTSFGGTTKQYHVDLDPGQLLAYGVDLGTVIASLAQSNSNMGGNYLSLGEQSFDVRGLGLIDSLNDIEDVVVAEKEGTPVYVRNLGQVTLGHAIRLGKVGVNDRDDVVEGIVLLMRGYQALPVLERVVKKVEELNEWKLPAGAKIRSVYDRTRLIHTTIETVTDILITGMLLVFVILFLFLGHVRTAGIVALTVPAALLFTFSALVMTGSSANLISLGAIDFGIIVDSTLLMVERIFSLLAQRPAPPGLTVHHQILRASRDIGRPVFFATTIIIVAFIPLFTMVGVPGKIFAPMSLTYGFALSGALLMAFTLAPALCSLLLQGPLPEEDPRLVRAIRDRYLRVLGWALDHERLVLGSAAGLFVLALLVVPLLGGEFMPQLEEGNLWVRATMPMDISFEAASRLVTDMRAVFRSFPETTTIVSQLGRPDDGTDPTSFFNAEFLVDLKPRKEWRPELTDKEHLIAEIEAALTARLPGVKFNFSQYILDNVQEAMSGVKGENAIKLYGQDLRVLEAKAAEILQVMKHVRGVTDLGIFHLMGQPNLNIAVDRQAVARYGLQVDYVNAVVQAAIGGQVVTQVYEGERWFDLVVRFLPQFRQDPEAIGRIQVSTPDGTRIPLRQLAAITLGTGPFIIYRENGERYIPIKFSVRGRDLESTVKDAQARLAEQVSLPERYRMEWHGEYGQLQAEKRRLAKIVPISLLIVLLLVYIALNSFKDAAIVLCAVPFALIGGIFALFLTRTDFSISAAVGFISLFGVAIQGALVDISRIHEYLDKGDPLRTAILKNAAVRMRPVMMTTLAAAIGLLPAAIATGIGAQTQQPLARVVVGGMLSSVTLILLVLPVLYQRVHRGDVRPEAAEPSLAVVGDEEPLP
ncbi:efflux RND transporter permease subunit [Nitrospira sp. Kam-Ns4a]